MEEMEDGGMKEGYPGVTTFVPNQASVIYNVFVKSVMHDAPRLVMPFPGIVSTEDQQ